MEDDEMGAEEKIAGRGIKKGILILGLVIFASFVSLIVTIYSLNLVSVGFILFFCMAITIALILTGPLFFSFESWKPTIDTHRIIQINATIIAGILIFLTLNGTTAQTAQNVQNITIHEWFAPSKVLSFNARSFIAALTTLTIIPFAISSIISMVWEDKSIHRRRRESLRHLPWETFTPNISEVLKKHNVTGVKLGITFTIAGFVWIIISMMIFVTIIFT